MSPLPGGWRRPRAVRTAPSRGLARCDAFDIRSVHVRESTDSVKLRVLGLRPTLLALEPANVPVANDRVPCTFRIGGGVLARRAGGTLMLTQIGVETAELRVAVKGFHPRLGLLYAPLEERLHASVSHRYLAGGTR